MSFISFYLNQPKLYAPGALGPLLLVAAAATTLSGCVSTDLMQREQPTPQQVVIERSVESASTVERALRPFAPTPNRPIDGPTTQEISQLRDTFVRTNSEDARLALATALALNPNSDERELALLLEPILRSEGKADALPSGDNAPPITVSSNSVRSYALILDSLAADRRALRDARLQLATKVKEVQVVTQQVKVTTDQSAARIKAEQRADELQTKVDQLQKKIDALLEIEKSMASKPARPAPK
jgi:hypothetical protein